MGLADVVAERQKPSAVVYSQKTLPGLSAELTCCGSRLKRELLDQGFSADVVTSVPYLNLRYQGTDTAIMIPRPGDGDFAPDLQDRLFKGIRLRPDRPGTFWWTTCGSGRWAALPMSASFPSLAPRPRPGPRGQGRVYFDRGCMETGIYDLDELLAGQNLAGPAIIIHDTSTILVEPGCRASITAYGDVEITVGAEDRQKIGLEVDPVQLFHFQQSFHVYCRTDGAGCSRKRHFHQYQGTFGIFPAPCSAPRVIWWPTAPHLPVHLGAMSAAVKEQIRRQEGNLKPGDVLVSNHPAAGGSHLPDITVITPVFKDNRIIFWVAARGHHADIGGISPGSMPPGSRRIEEEGALITSFKLVENGIFRKKA